MNPCFVRKFLVLWYYPRPFRPMRTYRFVIFCCLFSEFSYGGGASRSRWLRSVSFLLEASVPDGEVERRRPVFPSGLFPVRILQDDFEVRKLRFRSRWQIRQSILLHPSFRIPWNTEDEDSPQTRRHSSQRERKHTSQKRGKIIRKGEIYWSTVEHDTLAMQYSQVWFGIRCGRLSDKTVN